MVASSAEESWMRKINHHLLKKTTKEYSWFSRIKQDIIYQNNKLILKKTKSYKFFYNHHVNKEISQAKDFPIDSNFCLLWSLKIESITFCCIQVKTKTKLVWIEIISTANTNIPRTSWSLNQYILTFRNSWKFNEEWL